MGRFSYWSDICAKGFVLKGHHSDHREKHGRQKVSLQLVRQEVFNGQ